MIFGLIFAVLGAVFAFIALVCDIVLVKNSSGGVHSTGAGFWFTVIAIFLLAIYAVVAKWKVKLDEEKLINHNKMNLKIHVEGPDMDVGDPAVY